MAKYRDIAGVGKSKLFPKTYCQEPKRRHRKRYIYNLEHAKTVENFCNANGIKLTITNNGHHWKASKGNKVLEWWPSSAKVVFNKCWGRGIHVHDWQQYLKLIQQKILGRKK